MHCFVSVDRVCQNPSCGVDQTRKLVSEDECCKNYECECKSQLDVGIDRKNFDLYKISVVFAVLVQKLPSRSRKPAFSPCFPSEFYTEEIASCMRVT